VAEINFLGLNKERINDYFLVEPSSGTICLASVQSLQSLLATFEREVETSVERSF
jgi:hypothetical protein